MSKLKFFAPALAVGILGATLAVAETSDRHDRAGRPGAADFAAWHQSMCTDRYAGEVGRLAYLEAKLAVTDAQQSAFENWKLAVLAAAKSQRDACVAQTRDPSHRPTILDREARQQTMLKVRLSALDSELPALQSLYQALSPEQKAVFDRPHREHNGEGGRDGDHEGHHDPRADGPEPTR